MALARRVSFYFFRTTSGIFHQPAASTHDCKGIENIRKETSKNDMPVQIENPFTKEKPKCILCKLDIEPDYKNVRLLSQFISRHTGKVFGRHITGLCEKKQKKVMIEIDRARSVGLMPVMMKFPNYLDDPQLYDPSRPLRPHPY